MSDNWTWLRSYIGDDFNLEDQVRMLGGTVPRSICEMAHETYAEHHRQDLETLLARGGFSPYEIIGFLATKVLSEEAEVIRLRRLVTRKRAEEEQGAEVQERVQLLESTVRDLIRLLVDLGAAKDARAYVQTREAAKLVGETVR